MRLSVFIGASLDGFIARKNGDIDWLESEGSLAAEEDFGFKKFFDSVDCVVMGRNTLEKVMEFSKWPCEKKRVVILSRTLKVVPDQLVDKIELYSGSVQALVSKLKSEGFSRLYIDGGKTIQAFINEYLITDITITTIPILIGEGLSLFGKTPKDINLQHVATKSYTGGFVQSTYEFKY